MILLVRQKKRNVQSLLGIRLLIYATNSLLKKGTGSELTGVNPVKEW
jgi:hypothetical protein